MMRTPVKALFLVLVLLAAASVFAACGGGDDKPKESKLDDPAPDNPNFHVGVDATTFGGPVPLAIRFEAQPFHSTGGPVHYRWRFDDGTTSEERTPTKTFKRAGYYQVLLEARDAKGFDHWNLIVGAWPPKLWNYRQRTKGPLTRRAIRRLQSGQSVRTGKRRLEQLARSKRRAAQYSSKPAT